jgi:hypothetical protein
MLHLKGNPFVMVFLKKKKEKKTTIIIGPFFFFLNNNKILILLYKGGISPTPLNYNGLFHILQT